MHWTGDEKRCGTWIDQNACGYELQQNELPEMNGCWGSLSKHLPTSLCLELKWKYLEFVLELVVEHYILDDNKWTTRDLSRFLSRFLSELILCLKNMKFISWYSQKKILYFDKSHESVICIQSQNSISCKDWEWGYINHDIEDAFIFYAHVYCMYVHGLVNSRRSC